MSLCMAVVTLLAVAYVNLASTEECMGLCYRCPQHHDECNEGFQFAWVESFLREIKRNCPGLGTRPQDTTPRSTEPQTTTTKPGHADCQSLLDAGDAESGVYNITPAQYPDGLEVYCDMTTDSEGWIVFQRRMDGTVNFTRSWAEYRDGFGDKEGEFWLGNEILRRLTEPVEGEQEWQMRVDLDHVRDDGFNGELYALYDQFRITGELYNLSLVKNTFYYIGDSLSPPRAGNGHPFTTYDNDNDEDTAMNCADTLKGGWWFDNCGTKDSSETGLVYSNLNGEYGMKMTSLAFVRGIVWSEYAGDAFTESEMKMRRMTSY